MFKKVKNFFGNNSNQDDSVSNTDQGAWTKREIDEKKLFESYDSSKGESLRLKVKPKSYLNSLPDEVKESFLSKDYLPELDVILMLDTGDSYMNCSDNKLEELGISESDAFEIALKNSKAVEYDVKDFEVSPGVKVKYLFSDPSIAAVHAIEPDETLFGDMGFTFVMPSESELLWVAVGEPHYEDKLMMLAQVTEIRHEEVGDPLTPNIYLYKATGDYIVYGKK